MIQAAKAKGPHPNPLPEGEGTCRLRKRPLGRYRYVRLRWRLLFAVIDFVGAAVFGAMRAVGRGLTGRSPAGRRDTGDPKTILLVQLDHLGDAIITTAILPVLRKRFPQATIRVFSTGIGGSNTAGRLPGFDKEVLAHHPDVVTLEFVNDMGFPIDQLQARYTEILKRIRQANAAFVLITPHFTMPSWMKLPSGRGTDPRPAVASLRRFAKGNDLPIADASRRWEQLEAMGIPYETLLRNGINHPDDRGHEIFAEELMRLFPAE